MKMIVNNLHYKLIKGKVTPLIILTFLSLIIILFSCRKEEAYIPRVITEKDYEKFYEIPPIPDSCRAGILLGSIREKIMDTINYYRDSLGILPVDYNYPADNKVQESALLLVSNGDHDCDSVYFNCFTEWGMQCLCHNCNDENGKSVYKLMHFYTEIDLNSVDRISDMFIQTSLFVNSIDLTQDPIKLLEEYPFLRPDVFAVSIGRVDGKAELDKNTDNPDHIFCTAINLVCFIDEGGNN